MSQDAVSLKRVERDCNRVGNWSATAFYFAQWFKVPFQSYYG